VPSRSRTVDCLTMLACASGAREPKRIACARTMVTDAAAWRAGRAWAGPEAGSSKAAAASSDSIGPLLNAAARKGKQGLKNCPAMGRSGAPKPAVARPGMLC